MRRLLAAALAVRACAIPAGAGILDGDVSKGFRATLSSPSKSGRYELYDVSFPSPVKSPFPKNDTVWGRLFIPKEAGGAPRTPPPCVLVLPVTAAPNMWIEERFTHALVRGGFAVLLLELPYQFRRAPAPLVPTGQVFLARTARGLAANYRQSVLDARRAAAWLESSGLVDPERIGVFGVSLGAMVGASALSVEPRLKSGVFLLGGAAFPTLVAKSSMTGPYIRKAGIDASGLDKAWKGLDPLDYKARNRGKKVFLINARWDDVVPKENALALKDAFPDSRQVWVPFGHYTSIVHMIWIRSYVVRQFRTLLGP